MNISFDLYDEIKSSLSEKFGDLIDIEKLEIELSTAYPKDYKTLTYKWTHEDINIGIDGWYGEYDAKRMKIILYLPVISEPCSRIAHRYDRFLRVILFYFIGEWVCHNITLSDGSLNDDLFAKTGTTYRNFIALMYAFEFLKHEPSLVGEFNDVVGSLPDENLLCLKFIANEEKELPGIELSEIISLNQNSVAFQGKNISKNDLLETVWLNKYVSSCMENNASSILFFEEVLTPAQQKAWAHLISARIHGFFD